MLASNVNIVHLPPTILSQLMCLYKNISIQESAHAGLTLMF